MHRWSARQTPTAVTQSALRENRQMALYNVTRVPLRLLGP